MGRHRRGLTSWWSASRPRSKSSSGGSHASTGASAPTWTPLIARLEAGEKPGEQVQGTGYTVYKVRVRNTDAKRGTSGGNRVMYYLATADDLLLVAVYSKTEQDDVDNDTIVRVIRDDATVRGNDEQHEAGA